MLVRQHLAQVVIVFLDFFDVLGIVKPVIGPVQALVEDLLSLVALFGVKP